MDRADHPLRLWRKPRKISLERLACEVGVSASHLSEIENWNNTPSLELAAKLSRATANDVPLSAFVPGAGA